MPRAAAKKMSRLAYARPAGSKSNAQHIASTSQNSFKPAPPIKHKPQVHPDTWLEKLAGLVLSTSSGPKQTLPTWANKTGMKYKVRQRDGLNRVHEVPENKGSPLFRTAVRRLSLPSRCTEKALQDFSLLETGEKVYDSEEDDGVAYQWESRRQQHVRSLLHRPISGLNCFCLASHGTCRGQCQVGYLSLLTYSKLIVFHSLVYINQIWYLTCRAWGLAISLASRTNRQLTRKLVLTTSLKSWK